MISQRNLSLLSNRLARKGGRRIPEAVFERDYCISWFLIGMSHSPLKDILVFKGGTAIKKCYFSDYRFSEDLDFTINEKLPFENFQNNLDIALKYTQQASGIKLYFDNSNQYSHKNSYTFFLGFEGPLPAVSNKRIKVDITIKEKIVFPIENKAILRGYKEYEDLPENEVIYAYSLDEVATEKVIALLDRARNEPRDLYDIWYLCSGRYVSLIELIEAIKQKLEFRGKRLIDAGEEFLCKEVRLRKLWKIRLSSQIIVLPEFDKVYRTVKREFRQAGLLEQMKI